jgi:ribosome-binding factor A
MASVIMRYRIPSSKQVRRLCAEPGEEDGLDPRLGMRRSGRGGRTRHPGGGPAFGPGSAAPPVDRKAAQLCRQVAVTLDEVLAECRDDVLRDLHVVEVAPFPDASRLLVTVSAVDAGAPGSPAPEAVLEHLQHAGGHLRREVASAVTRRRAPLLVYRLGDSSMGIDSPQMDTDEHR